MIELILIPLKILTILDENDFLMLPKNLHKLDIIGNFILLLIKINVFGA